VKLIGLIIFSIFFAHATLGRFGKSFAFESFKDSLTNLIIISFIKTKEMDAITHGLHLLPTMCQMHGT